MADAALQVADPNTTAVRPATITSARAVGLLRPIAAPADVLEAQNDTRAMIKAALQEGRDYGVVPGTERPTLLKPGAERTALAFGCYYGEPEIIEREIEHDRRVEWVKRKKKWRNEFKGDREFTWEEESGVSSGLYRYVVRVPVINRADGSVVGSGIGACSSMESKYVDRPRDSENTILKMAHKRAVVSAALITFGLSDEFTQDAEDLAANGVIDADDPAAGEPKPKCPKCAGTMWDNREGKRNPKAPDYKCKDKKCEGAYWPGEWPPKTEDAAAEPTVSEEGAPDPITPATPWPSGENEGVPINLLPDKFLRWATADGRKLGDRTLEWQAACSDVLDSRAETRRKKPVLADEVPF